MVSLLLTLNIFHTFFQRSFVDFEHVFVYWETFAVKDHCCSILSVYSIVQSFRISNFLIRKHEGNIREFMK